VATRHASALKAHRQTLTRTAHNRELRARLRTSLKAIRSAIDGGNVDESKARMNETVSIIDKMAGRGIIHRNAAGRYKSRLVKRLGAAAAKKTKTA
jgi:small subunit ribosomal protein S20